VAGFFAPVIALIAQGHHPHAALFVENHFNATTSRNWTGLGTITLAGHDWIGTGELVKLGALAFGGDDAAPGLTLTLSGVDPAFVSEARTMPSVHGLEQFIYLQFFDAATLAPVGDFYELDRRFLDVIGFSIQGPNTASVSLSSESEWTGLNTGAYQDWSTADQDALFAGDRGLEYIGDLVYGQRIAWPDFSDSG
jgi:hypothetical protein